MLSKMALIGMAMFWLLRTGPYAQSVDTVTGKALSFPARLLGKLQSRTAGLDQQLTQQTEKYLQKMQRREDRLRKKLAAVDSNAAKQLFAGSAQRYAALAQKIRTDTGTRNIPLSGTYMPYADSLQGALGFLQKNPGLLSGAGGANAAGVTSAASAKLQSAASQFQALQAKMADADQARAFIQQRKQQISQYISQHANLQRLLSKQYAGMNQDVYYYSQQLRQYKEMWNNPDQLEQKALALLNKLPAFQTFMKNNSHLAGLFHLPPNYRSPDPLPR